MKSTLVTSTDLSYISPLNTTGYLTEVASDGTTQQKNVMLVLKGTNLMYVVDLDLSCNGLPEELTNLSALIGLNFSHNHLTGNIPINIGEMRALESLDLSNKNLSGRIPSSLGAITSLRTLNLSCNKLHGELPTGSQLQTLNDPSIYGNNAGLCGDPLPLCETKHGKQKQEEEDDQDEDDGEDNRKKVWVSLDVMLGLETGFWGVVGTLLINKKRKHAFFERVDDFGD
ncbi:receptor-like protein EIX2 [Amaranthus tricolor]|uniref:receptor-like protein EIX2 n=1 Tax=Amaranthus tricolor TaxID=29722 RepID=UPI00258CD416|nr:receptor-like protein EIX2 [Amaranthus tricolor]